MQLLSTSISIKIIHKMKRAFPNDQHSSSKRQRSYGQDGHADHRPRNTHSQPRQHKSSSQLNHHTAPPNIWKHYLKHWSTVEITRDNSLVMTLMKTPSSYPNLSLRSTQLPPRWTCSNLLPSEAPKLALRFQQPLSHPNANTSLCLHCLRSLMVLIRRPLSYTSPAASMTVLLQSAT
jgi:hypothetical protein